MAKELLTYFTHMSQQLLIEMKAKLPAKKITYGDGMSKSIMPTNKLFIINCSEYQCYHSFLQMTETIASVRYDLV